jgi:BASS family bile acid:Na+ symporter
VDPVLIKRLITASILLLVFALGVRATFADATSLFRDLFKPPRRLLRALVAMYVVVPATAAGMGLAFDLVTPVRVALLAVSIAPIPPILPGKQLKVGGSSEHVFGLLVAISVSSIVLVPVMVEVLGGIFGRDSSFGPRQVAGLLGITILAPLAAGLILRQLARRWAEPVATWASRLGTVLLVAGVIMVLVASWPAMSSLILGGALFAMLALAAIAIGVGHWLGGPDPSDRSTLAIAAAMRHPGVAIAVATANVPEEPRLTAAILLYVLVAVILTSVYVAVARRRHAAAT